MVASAHGLAALETTLHARLLHGLLHLCRLWHRLRLSSWCLNLWLLDSSLFR